MSAISMLQLIFTVVRNLPGIFELGTRRFHEFTRNTDNHGTLCSKVLAQVSTKTLSSEYFWTLLIANTVSLDHLGTP